MLLNLLNMLGGIGMFLFGMNLLGSSLERYAGAKLERTLEKLANTRIKGVLLGTVVTAVIQSSSATSVMVVGFVNAGIMKLAHGVAVMMGGNIGTTITGQILRLGDVSSQSLVMTLIKPTSFAPVFIAIGAFIRLFSKRERTKELANIIIGFGIIFVGMSTIETNFAPLGEQPAFQRAFMMLTNPLLGFAVGFIVTSILQSASASVGVLQAVAATGEMSFAMAAPIVLGMNVGKFVPVMMASSGTGKKAKRAVIVNIMICTFGAVIFMAAMYAWQGAVGFSFWNETAGRGRIADFNTLFNLLTTVIMFPFTDLLIKLSGIIARDNEVSKMDQELQLLDARFLKTPTLAIEQSMKVIVSMGQTARENLEIATGLLETYDESKIALLEDNESFLDKTETVLSEYLVEIAATNHDSAHARDITEILHAVSDFERIGDYCVNIADTATYNEENDCAFSDMARRELGYLMSAAQEICEMAVQALRDENGAMARSIEPLEETIDSIVELLKQKHTGRLQRGECDIQRGISFMEILTNVERISDHCSNIGVHITQRLSNDERFDAHAELNRMHNDGSEEYKALCEYYGSIYRDPLL